MATTTEEVTVSSPDMFSVYRSSECRSEGPSTIVILPKKQNARKRSGRQIRKKTQTISIVAKRVAKVMRKLSPALDARKRKIPVRKEAPKQTEA
jgi:hypothetical protein